MYLKHIIILLLYRLYVHTKERCPGGTLGVCVFVRNAMLPGWSPHLRFGRDSTVVWLLLKMQSSYRPPQAPPLSSPCSVLSPSFFFFNVVFDLVCCLLIFDCWLVRGRSIRSSQRAWGCAGMRGMRGVRGMAPSCRPMWRLDFRSTCRGGCKCNGSVFVLFCLFEWLFICVFVCVLVLFVLFCFVYSLLLFVLSGVCVCVFFHLFVIVVFLFVCLFVCFVYLFCFVYARKGSLYIKSEPNSKSFIYQRTCTYGLCLLQFYACGLTLNLTKKTRCRP